MFEKFTIWAVGPRGKRFLIGEAVIIAILIQVVIWDIYRMTAIGMALDIMLLGMASGVLTLLLWPFFAGAKRALIVMLPQTAPRLARAGYLSYAMIVFAALLGPHLWMSAKLTPLREEFLRVADQGGSAGIYFTGEYADGRSVNAMDFGGALDDIVGKRTTVLAKYQFVPLFTGRWETSTGGSRTYMAYVYTFLPRDTYRRLLVKLATLSEHPKPDPKMVRKEMEEMFAKVNL